MSAVIRRRYNPEPNLPEWEDMAVMLGSFLSGLLLVLSLTPGS